MVRHAKIRFSRDNNFIVKLVGQFLLYFCKSISKIFIVRNLGSQHTVFFVTNETKKLFFHKFLIFKDNPNVLNPNTYNKYFDLLIFLGKFFELAPFHHN